MVGSGGAEPKPPLSSSSPGPELGPASMATATPTAMANLGVGDGGRGMAGSGIRKDDPFYPGMEEVDLGDGGDGGNGGGSGNGARTGVGSMTTAAATTPFMIPPAGTRPGDPGYDPYYQQLQLLQHQQTQLAAAAHPRPVSAFTAYPSPGQPILPVSPLTPHFPNPSQQQHVPSSYRSPGGPGGALVGGGGGGIAEMNSPTIPAFLIPGGNGSRAVSFSSMSGAGGGPRVAELVGSPPSAIPSMYVVVEGGPSPTTATHRAELAG
ncbi:hypothetical protein VTK26DRAFT_3257 [Humicola hyalothermophila]